MEPIRVLLVDDHVLFRKGIASLMSSRQEFEVVAEASDGYEAQDLARQLMPDLILMDIHMPGCDGLTATQRIKAEMPYARIIMLTVSDEDNDLFEAIKNGAQGYLLKNLKPDELFELLKGVVRGEAPISPVVAAKMLGEFTRQTPRESRTGASSSSLTSREREILQLVVDGSTNKEIAVRLCITEGTVKNHLHNILEKLHLENRVQAAAFALREGLLDGRDR